MNEKVFSIIPLPLSALWGFFLVIFLCVALAGFIAYLAVSARNIAFTIDEGGLRIRGGLYGRYIEKASIRQGEIELLDLRNYPDLQPKRRINGLHLPRYKIGWFRLKNGVKALIFLIDNSQAIFIPTRNGYSVLLSPDHPEEFVRTINALW